MSGPRKSIQTLSVSENQRIMAERAIIMASYIHIVESLFKASFIRTTVYYSRTASNCLLCLCG